MTICPEREDTGLREQLFQGEPLSPCFFSNLILAKAQSDYVVVTSRGAFGALGFQPTPIPLPLTTPRLHLQASLLSLCGTDYCTLCQLLFGDCDKKRHDQSNL